MKWKHRPVSRFWFKIPQYKQGNSKSLCSPLYLDSVQKRWTSCCSWVCITKNLPPAPCLHKQVPTKSAEIKALTVISVQISSCLNMCYKNLWCYRKRRNLEEKVRLSLRITAPQGPASTWNKEMYLKEMFASRLYPLPIFEILVSILYNLATVSCITKPE